MSIGKLKEGYLQAVRSSNAQSEHKVRISSRKTQPKGN